MSCGCLNGITRQTVIRLAGAMNMISREVKAKPEDLFHADEAFLTSSLLELMPLTCVEGRLIGSGGAGPVTLGLLKGYRKLVERSGAGE